MSDLNFVSTDDMIEELKKRFDTLVIVGEKVLTDGEGEMLYAVSGDPLKCLGLTLAVQPKCLPDRVDNGFEE